MTQPGLFDASPTPEVSGEDSWSHLVQKPAEDAMLRQSLLVQTLQLAVPMWIDRAAERGALRDALLAEWREEACEVVLSEGDNILYRARKRGDTARAFNALARGLAVLAYAPGGVTAFGLVWCAWHSPGGANLDGPPCPTCCADELRTDLAAAMRRLLVTSKKGTA